MGGSNGETTDEGLDLGDEPEVEHPGEREDPGNEPEPAPEPGPQSGESDEDE